VTVHIALVGDRKPSHPSHRELDAILSMLGEDVSAEWVATDGDRIGQLAGFDGIWLVPGSPYADDAAAYEAVRWARENDVPFFGTCGGLQYAVVEYFRNVLGVCDASHAESDGERETNVVHALACGLQGEERPVRPIAGTRFARLVGGEPFVGMHYCSYGPGPDEVRRLVSAGMVVEATADDAGAEVIELPEHRFFMLTLFQPHIGALAGKPLHPLVREFVRCARAYAEGRVGGAEGRVGGVEGRFGGVEGRFGGADGRVGGADADAGAVGGRFG
jgi:CTP synthase (UTP-ammonia lyase)